MKIKRIFALFLFLISALLISCEKGGIPSGSISDSLEAKGEDKTLSAPTETGEEKPDSPISQEVPKFFIDEMGIVHKNLGLKGKKADDFELPLCGATGFASYPLTLFAQHDQSVALRELSPGDAFTVLEERGENWLVRTEDGVEGLVAYATCYLNIPDVIPSVVLDNTNAEASLFVSSGEAIPEITGQKLYDSFCYSERFGKEKNVVAANYNMVKKIYAIQKAALAEGYTLVINETFRPLDVQRNVSAALAALRLENEVVREGLDQPPWSIAWFIASGVSTHQMGCAMDVTLARVTGITWGLCGDYLYSEVTGWQECSMPTAFHELSSAAASLKKPVSSSSPTAWKGVDPAASMTEDALRLRFYCTEAGMSPLASEWWHFNDLETKEMLDGRWVEEVFHLSSCVSKIPD